MGYLLFVGGTLCERAVLTGGASRWERMEMRRTRFQESWCFHLFNHQSGLPVCFNVVDGSSQATFVIRRATNPGEMVVFAVQDFKEGMACVKAEKAEATSMDLVDASSSQAAHGVLGLMARSTQSAVRQAWALPRLLLRGPNLIGALGAGLFSAGEPVQGASVSSFLTAGSTSTTSLAVPRHSTSSISLAQFDSASSFSNKKVDELHPAFQLLEGSVADARSGEPLEADTVVRGSRRVEKVRFTTTQDLTDVFRVVKVYIALMTFTDKIPMGSFNAREEPHEFTFPEKDIPWTSPPGTYKIRLSFTAANIKGPLYVESSKFRMV